MFGCIFYKHIFLCLFRPVAHCVRKPRFIFKTSPRHSLCFNGDLLKNEWLWTQMHHCHRSVPTLIVRQLHCYSVLVEKIVRSQRINLLQIAPVQRGKQRQLQKFVRRRHTKTEPWTHTQKQLYQYGLRLHTFCILPQVLE